MVKELAGAVGLVVNSGGVKLEAHVRGVNSDGDWADHLNSVGESTLVTRGDVVAGRKAGSNVSRVENAFAVFSGVWV